MRLPMKKETMHAEESVSQVGTPPNVVEDGVLSLRAQETEDLDTPLLLDHERQEDAM